MYKIKKIEILLNVNNLEAIEAVKRLLAYTRKWRMLFMLIFVEFLISILAKAIIELRETEFIRNFDFPLIKIALIFLLVSNTIIFAIFSYFLMYF